MGIGLFGRDNGFIGLARPKKNVEAILIGASDAILEHFLKVLLFEDERNIEHWCSELAGFLRKILSLRIKPDMKVPKASWIRGAYGGSMENEREAKSEVDWLLGNYEGKVIYADLLLGEGLNYKRIVRKWKEFVGFINDKYAKGEDRTTLEELREVIGR